MKALIVDDEPLPARLLKELIEQHCFEISAVEMLFSPAEALKRLEKTHFDLIFLDVEMPQINGLEFVKKAKLSSKTQVIYTTAYSTYAVEAFKVNAAHYIVKPIEEEELILAVRKAQLQLKKIPPHTQVQEKFISIFYKNEYIVHHHNDIIRLEGNSGYTKVVVGDKEYISSKRLGYYENELDPSIFIRCHHSHIINGNYITRISKGKNGYITLSNNEIIPYSSTNKKNLKQFINT